jgi:hypothetical protein
LNGPFVNRRHAGRPNPAEVLKVLIQSDKTERKVASAHVPPGQVMWSPKDLASNVDESFSVQDFLVGSNDSNSSLIGRTQPATSQFKPPVSIEDLLGISSVSVVPHVPAKAFRHTAEVLVDQRYRYVMCCCPHQFGVIHILPIILSNPIWFKEAIVDTSFSA